MTSIPASPLVDIGLLCEIAGTEFSDIVVETLVPGLNELRILLVDSSFLDVWFSLKLADRYSYHWERRAIDGRIYRHDNAPHKRWQSIPTFPRHFHNGSEMGVTECYQSDPRRCVEGDAKICEGLSESLSQSLQQAPPPTR